jgi:predicted ATPase
MEGRFSSTVAALIAQIREGLVAWQATGAKLWRPYYLALLAEAYGKAGRTEEGLAALAEALAAVEETEERHYEAELRRLQGELLLQQTAGEAATDVQAQLCFEQALVQAGGNVAPVG